MKNMKKAKEITKCEYCRGRLDRPAYSYCGTSGKHIKPNLAQSIVIAIAKDMESRHGLCSRGVDPEIRDEMWDDWTRIVERKLRLAANYGCSREDERPGFSGGL